MNQKIDKRINTIIEHIDLVEQDLRGVTLDHLGNDSILLRATCLSFMFIGESMIKLESLIGDKYPHIVWREARSIRNFIAHDYGGIQIETIYNTAKRDLQPLKESLLAIKNDYKTGKLATDRLILRHIKKDDTEQVFNNWANDPEVTKYMTWNAHENIETTKEIMKRWLEEENKPETHRFVISLKTTGELIGMIDVVDTSGDQAKIGYCSGRKYWGNGYMTEACKAFMKYLFDIGYQTLVICADERNIGSNRVIEKCGFTFTHKETRNPISEFKSGTCVVNCYERRKTAPR